MNDLHITTSGKALDDAQLTYTQSGKAVARVRIVIGHRKKVGDSWEDAGATFLDCQAWDQMAEHVAESVRKGDRVLVTGRMTTEKWTGNDGTERTTQRLALDDIGLSMRWNAVRAAASERQKPSQPAPQQRPPQGRPQPMQDAFNDAPPF